MRHLRSILYALVLAPAAWTLSAVGFTRELTGRARDGGSVETFTGLLLLLLAGAAYALLVFAPISPLGPALAGAAFLGVCVWAIAAPGSYGGVWPAAVAKEGFDLSLPGYGLAALLAVPLLGTALSARRWAGYQPVELPLIGVLGRARGAAPVAGESVQATRTAVITPADPTEVIERGEPRRPTPHQVPAAGADEAGRIPAARRAAADNGDEPTVLVTGGRPETDEPTVVVPPRAGGGAAASTADDEPTVATHAGAEGNGTRTTADEPTVAVPAAPDESATAASSSDDEPTVAAGLTIDGAAPGEPTVETPRAAVADDDATADVTSRDGSSGSARPVGDETTDTMHPAADDSTEMVVSRAANAASPDGTSDEATVSMTADADKSQETDTGADSARSTRDADTTEFVTGADRDKTAEVDSRHDETAEVTAPRDETETADVASQDETADVTPHPEKPTAEESTAEEPAAEEPTAEVPATSAVTGDQDEDDGDRTQLIRLPGGDTGRYAPGEVTQVIPREFVRQRPTDPHDEKTQVIRLPAAARDQDVDGGRTQVIGYRTGTVEPPGDQTQVLRFPVPAQRRPQSMDEPDTRPQSILGAERPDPGADPTTRLALPPHRPADETGPADQAPRDKPAGPPRRRPSFKDMERPADEVADDTRRLVMPPQDTA